MDFYADLAGQAAANTAVADDKKEAIIQGLAGITYALMDVAAAIRESAGLKDRCEVE